MKYETPELHPLMGPIGTPQGTIEKATQQIQESMPGDPAREAFSAYVNWELLSVKSSGVRARAPIHCDFAVPSCNFRNLCQRAYISTLAGSGSS